VAVSESDVRARYNLAWVHQRERDYDAALQVLAEALALDRTGEYRDRLLQKQQEVLGGLAARPRQEYLLLINLVSKYAKAGEASKPTAAEAVASAPAEAGAEERDPRGTEVGGGACDDRAPTAK
jgi:hypothetical protein